MQFSKETILSGVKMALSPAARSRRNDLDMAMSLCVDDLSMKLQSVGMMTYKDETVAISTRTQTVSGDGGDLQYIYAVKFGTGSDQKLLEYVDQIMFLKQYDDPSATADEPTYYTILTSSEGHPTIKFDVPTSAADTMRVYYFAELTKETMTKIRSGSALVNGTLAYFLGTAGEGAGYYERFKEGVKQMRASDNFRTKKHFEYGTSREDIVINNIKWNLRDKRS